MLDFRRQQFEGHLRLASSLTASAPAILREAIEYCLFAPGKRLRPLLTILAAEAVGGEMEGAMPAACAIEMVHTYSLIHDDLPAMDNDDLRRGRPTCHKKFGEALAILTGDALLTMAFEWLVYKYPPVTASKCCRYLATGAGAGAMIGGQVQDLTWEGKISGRSGSCTLENLEDMHSRKTGALFQAALLMGNCAVWGENPNGPDRSAVECLEGFGRNFGLMFQVTDDLLDAAGETRLTGKNVGRDAAKGKPTYATLLGVEQSRRFAEELAQQAEASLTALGPKAEPLAALARSIVARDR